jgi:hypothetical protein
MSMYKHYMINYVHKSNNLQQWGTRILHKHMESKMKPTAAFV